MIMDKVISNKVYESIQPSNIQPESTGKILYANQYSGLDMVNFPEDLKDLLDSDVGLNGTNLFIQLSNKFQFFRNGPWYVDSRDGVLYIHNRKFREEPVYSYIYQNENGEVLSTQFTTNYRTKRVRAVLHQNIDPDTKQIDIQRTEFQEPEDQEIFVTGTNSQIEVYTLEGDESLHHYATFNDANEANKFLNPIKQYNYELWGKEYQKRTDERIQEMQSIIEGTPEFREKVKQDAINAQLDKMDSRSLLLNYINDSDRFPDDVRRQLVAAFEEAKTNPKSLDPNLQKILDGHYIILDGENMVTYPAVELLDPANYVPDELRYRGRFNYYGREITSNDWLFNKIDGLEALRKSDPYGEVVNVKWEDGIKVLGNLGTETVKYPDMVEIYRKIPRAVKVPLYQIYHNLYSRYGGIDKYAWAASANANGGLKQKEKEIICNMTVVGRPSLQSSVTINLFNFGKRWSGPWYIKKCTHRMDPGMGYICELSLIQNKAVAGQTTSYGQVSTTRIRSNNASVEGNTQYGKNKPIIVDITELVNSFTKTEIMYWGYKYIIPHADKEGNIKWDEVDVKQLGSEIANHMAFMELYADDPIKKAGGTVTIPGSIYNSQGYTEKISNARVERVPDEVLQKYLDQFDPSKLSNVLKDGLKIMKIGDIEGMIYKVKDLPVEFKAGNFILPIPDNQK